MNEFDFDVMQKKRIAASAFHKKNGSKSKGCRLPSDSLTAAEKRKLNGPVKTTDLDQPMTWKEFKKLPTEQQKMYIERLMDLYGASVNMLAHMFGIANKQVGQALDRLQIPRRPQTYRPTTAQHKMFKAFCGGVVGGAPKTDTNVPEIKPDAKQEASDPVSATEGLMNSNYAPVVSGSIRAKPSQMAFSFNNVETSEDLISFLRTIPFFGKAKVSVSISFEEA